MKRLEKQEDFDRAEREGRLVGKFDKYMGDRLHLLPCSGVKGQHFYEKVVRNRGKNGHYEQYESFEEVPDYLLDHACPHCFKGASSLRALVSRPEFRQRLMEMQRQRAASATVPAATAHSAPQPGQRDPVVQWRGAAGEALECWCSRQLDLEGKPPDVRGVLRGLMRQHIPRLVSKPGQVLSARYVAPRLLDGSDVENVLFTNPDATGGLFRSAAGRGVIFEFWPEDPRAGSSALPLACCSVYECVEPGQPSTRWVNSELLAEWGPIPVPSFQTATRCGPIWWDLRRGAVMVHVPPQRPQFFAVHLELHAPANETVNAAAKIKVAVDAAVLSLCCDDGTSKPEGIARFAATIGQPEPAVRAILQDPTRAVFGSCRTVDARGQANPPDSGCVQGSLSINRDEQAGWSLAGRVLALRPRASS